jgi:hypothetical protein
MRDGGDCQSLGKILLFVADAHKGQLRGRQLPVNLCQPSYGLRPHASISDSYDVRPVGPRDNLAVRQLDAM